MTVKFYATFGVGHTFCDKYVALEFEDEALARHAMHETFGTKWGFIYTAEQFLDYPEKWKCSKLCTIYQNSYGNYRVRPEEETA